MINDLEKIRFLIEAQYLLQPFAKKIIVIKYGGIVMQDMSLTENIVQDIVLLHSMGIKIILVHGGGTEINSWLEKMNITTKFCDGIRITDFDTMKVVEMVLTGRVNKMLVKLINKYNVNAVGISGQDASFITVEPVDKTFNNFVANVKTIDPSLILTLLNQHYIPVISPIASDDHGRSYNINADIVAGAVASTMNASQMIVLTDTGGILLQPDNPRSVIDRLDLNEIQQLINCKIITGGMLPKVKTCIKVLLSSCCTTSIIDGRVPHCLLYHLLTDKIIGSTITK